MTANLIRPRKSITHLINYYMHQYFTCMREDREKENMHWGREDNK
jgi:hypothetical protein